MQKRSLVVLVIGVLIALGTAWSLKQRMQHTASEAAAVQVLVAASPIEAGAFVRTASQLVFVNWPEENISEQMLTSRDTKLTDFEGAVARREVNKGEPIQRGMLVRADEGGFMSAVLDPGKRAISIAVDPTSGNAGFIFPGDYVDLILTHSEQNGQSPVRASETFVRNVRVLAVDQMLHNPENKAMLAKTVTLEVTPKQAEEINVAKDLGKISLSLRSLATERKAIDKAPADAAAADAAQKKPIETFDDVLRAASDIGKQGVTAPAQPAAPVEEPESITPNVTRDADVSHIITPSGGANTRVRVIHGSKYEDMDFGPGTKSNEGVTNAR